jgi:hypothetical protein
MKKVITTLTAVAFALGLAAAGQAQTAGKEVEKSAVKTEAPAAQPQVAPKEMGKPGEAAKTVGKEVAKPGAEKAVKAAPEPVKNGDKEKAKKDHKKHKAEKKTVTPVEKPKEEKQN